MGRTATIRLPRPRDTSGVSVETALAGRRSIRSFKDETLSLEELSQLLWAAQGRTTSGGGRTAPSAGGLYPLEAYAVVGRVSGLEAATYRYRPTAHRLETVAEGDRRAELARASVSQGWMANAPAWIALAGVEHRTAREYGGRAPVYVHFEAGCASQNAALQAEALGLGTCIVGAFDDEAVARLLGLGLGERPLALMPFGRGGS